jgi:hypothetical protein
MLARRRIEETAPVPSHRNVSGDAERDLGDAMRQFLSTAKECLVFIIVGPFVAIKRACMKEWRK